MATRKLPARTRRGFGALRKLPSGRWQASYVDPDKIKRAAPDTFDTKEDAEAWLTDRRREISAGEWAPPAPKVAPLTFGEYAERWYLRRCTHPTKPLAARTRGEYRRYLNNRILPTFGEVPLKHIDEERVEKWYYAQPNTPTMTARVYSFFHTVLESALKARLIPYNPARIENAETVDAVHIVKVLSVPELDALVANMAGRSKRYGVMVQLTAWCVLRFSEVTELRRKDVDLVTGRLHVHRAVTRDDETGELVIGPPKAGSIRDVTIPPHIRPIIAEHMETILWGPEALLFPAAKDATKNMSESSMTKPFYRARRLIGRSDLHFHDLRHTGATWGTRVGASLRESMNRAGHSTVDAAMRYQNTMDGREEAIAEALSVWALAQREVI